MPVAPQQRSQNMSNNQGVIGSQNNNDLMNTLNKAPKALTQAVNHALDQSGRAVKDFGGTL